MDLYGKTHVHLCACRVQRMTWGIFLKHFSTLTLRQDISGNLPLANSAIQSQQSPGNLLSPLPGHWHCHHTWLKIIQVLMFAWQAIYLLSQLPAHELYLFAFTWELEIQQMSYILDSFYITMFSRPIHVSVASLIEQYSVFIYRPHFLFLGINWWILGLVL